jgi:hypothetical protein
MNQIVAEGGAFDFEFCVSYVARKRAKSGIYDKSWDINDPGPFI